MLCCGDTVHFDECGGIMFDFISVTNQGFALVRVWSAPIDRERGTRLVREKHVLLRAFSGLNRGL